jgi:hypothetical protein
VRDATLRVAKSATEISRLAPTTALEDVILMRIAEYVQRAVNSAVSILSVLESAENSAFLAQSHALGFASIAVFVTCLVERHVADFLAIYVATVVSNVVINARQFAEKFVQAKISVSNVARQS